MLTMGRVDPAIVEVAETQRFDQLPVLNPRGKLQGLVTVKHARELLHQGRVLEETDPALRLYGIAEHPSLLSLLEELSNHRALIFRSAKGEAGSDWFALVTISDLNRHAFRAYLYPILAQLEALLAELIDRYFDVPWDWLLSLRPERQVPIVGRWELEKRNSVETSPTVGAMLTDLLEAVAGCEEIRGELGYTSKNQFRKSSGDMPDLRNRIMHPARPLVLNHEEVKALRSTCEAVLALIGRVSAFNAKLVAENDSHRRSLHDLDRH